MSNSRTQIPSPARSQGAMRTPRRYLTPRKSRSVCSPTRSNASGRLTTLIQEHRDQDKNSFVLSPLARRSLLPDDTDIEVPGRKSWWKNLNDNSRDVIEILKENAIEPHNIMEELNIEVLSQEEKKQYTLDLPDSSDSESINSIIIPHKRLFNEKENRPQRQFDQFGTRGTLDKVYQPNTGTENVPCTATKELFHNKPISRPAFPAGLLDVSANTTASDKTLAAAIKPRAGLRNIFGTQQTSKRKNMFAKFIESSEYSSEEEIVDVPEVKKKFFDLQKPGPQRRQSARSSSRFRNASLTSNVTTDSFADWDHLPSSTMVENQLEAVLTEGHKAKRSKLSEPSSPKTNNITKSGNKSKQSDISVSSKNKSKSMIKNKQVDEIVQNTSQNSNDKENNKINSSTMHQTIQNSINNVINKTVDVSSDKNIRIQNEIKAVNENNKMDFDEGQNMSLKKQQLEKQKSSSIIEQDENITNQTLNISQITNLEKAGHKITEESAEIPHKTNDISNTYRQNDKEVVMNYENVHEVEMRGDENQKIANLEENVEKEMLIKSLEPKDKNVANTKDIVLSDSKNHDQEIEQNKIENNEREQNEMENAEEINENKQNESKVANIETEVQNESQKSHDRNKSIDNNADSDDGKDQSQDYEEEENEIEDYKEKSEEEQIEIDNENEINKSQEDQNESHERPDVSKVLEGNESEAGNNENQKEIEDDKQNADEVHNQEIVYESEDEIEDEEQNKSEVDNQTTVQETEEENLDEENDNEVEAESDIENQESEDNESGVEEDANEIEDQETEHEVSNLSIEASAASEEDNQSDHESENEQVHESDQESEIEEKNESDQEVEYNQNDDDNPIDNTLTLDISHDTAGRNRKKGEEMSLEAGVFRPTKELEHSIIGRGRNTSVRKSKSMINPQIELEKIQENNTRGSLSLSEGGRNSSVEGSGWDSHRTTRKTLRQTFGKDFTPRKSLRALVMEKSAKRHTLAREPKDTTSAKIPLANSTELGEPSMAHDYEMQEDALDSIHEVSIRTRKATLEEYLLKIRKENEEKRAKMADAVKRYIAQRPKESNLFKVPARPTLTRRVTKPKPKCKNPFNPLVPIEELPEEMQEDLKYKPPKRFAPRNAGWLTKRFYKYVESKLEPKYDYKARVRAEKFAQTLYGFVQAQRRREVALPESVAELKHEMARLKIVKTHFEFYNFFWEFMPREIRVKVIPDLTNKIPQPRSGIFSDILDSEV